MLLQSPRTFINTNVHRERQRTKEIRIEFNFHASVGNFHASMRNFVPVCAFLPAHSLSLSLLPHRKHVVDVEHTRQLEMILIFIPSPALPLLPL